MWGGGGGVRGAQGGDGAILHANVVAETERMDGVGVGGRVRGPHHKRVFCVHGACDEGLAVGGPGGGAHGFGVDFEGAEAFSGL